MEKVITAIATTQKLAWGTDRGKSAAFRALGKKLRIIAAVNVPAGKLASRQHVGKYAHGKQFRDDLAAKKPDGEARCLLVDGKCPCQQAVGERDGVKTPCPQANGSSIWRQVRGRSGATRLDWTLACGCIRPVCAQALLFTRNKRRARPIGQCPLHEVSMRRHFLLYYLSALVVSGCSEPRCPFGLMKRGDTCYRCKVGEAYVNGSCTSAVDGGEVEASDGDTTLESDAGDSEDAQMPDETGSLSCAVDNGGCDPEARCVDGVSGHEAPTCECPEDRISDDRMCVPKAVALSTSPSHACAVLSDGSLWCWGSNESGQLGLGEDVVDFYFGQLPARVGTDSDWTGVSAAQSHTCGIRAGNLYCWGRNTRSELGLGESERGRARAEPTLVSSGAWLSVSIDGSSSCGLRGEKGRAELFCWGESIHIPTPLGNATDRWRAVSAGRDHACAIRDNGALYCWGQNSYGELGIGAAADPVSIYAPTRVGAQNDWTAIATGSGCSCGLRASGEMYCWGNASCFPDRSPGASDALSPERAGTWDDWQEVDLSAGAINGCGRRRDTEVWCWGSNEYGQVGHEPSTDESYVAASHVEGNAWSTVTVGGTFNCGIVNGTVLCWGLNRRLALGTHEIPIERLKPTQVGAGSDWKQVVAGVVSTCGLRGSSLYCWGLRSDLKKFVPTPTRVGNEMGWSQIALTSIGMIALRGGQVYRLGGTPADLALEPVVDVSSGGWEFITASGNGDPLDWADITRCGLKGTSLLCWGANAGGMLGQGDVLARLQPVQVPGEWSFVSAQRSYVCGVTAGRLLYCWGGSLGSSPVQIGMEAGWADVAPEYLSMGIREGSLYQWMNGSAPTRFGNGTDWTSVSGYQGTNCALRNGVLYCWGFNGEGQVGNGERSESDRVVDPALIDDGSLSRWVDVSAGSSHSCGVRENGTLWCWGSNVRGQLGLGPAWAGAPSVVRFR